MRWLILTLLQNAVLGTVAILAIFGIRLLLGKKLHPQWRYRLWLIAALCLLIPVRIPSPASLLNVIPQSVAEPVAVQAAAAPSDFAQTFAPTYIEPAILHRFDSPTPAPNALDSFTIVFLIWMAGAILAAIYFATANIRFFLRTRESYVDAEAEACAEKLRLSLGIRRSVRIRVCPTLPSPCMTALFPCILLNEKSMQDRTTLRYALMHELCHIRQRDIAAAWMRLAAQIAFWFHPLVWIAARCSMRDAELSCDAAVMSRLNANEKVAYGMTLLRMLPQNNRAFISAATNMAVGRKLINERIRMMTRMPKKRWIVAVSVAALALVLAACTMTGAIAPMIIDPLPEAPSAEPSPTPLTRVAATSQPDTAEPEPTKLPAISAEPIDLRYFTTLYNNPSITDETLTAGGSMDPTANDRYDEALRQWNDGERPASPAPAKPFDTGFAILPTRAEAYGSDHFAILPNRALTDEEMLQLVDAFHGQGRETLTTSQVWISVAHNEITRFFTEDEAYRYNTTLNEAYVYEGLRPDGILTEDPTDHDIAYVVLNPHYTNGLEELWLFPNYEMTDEQILMLEHHRYRNKPLESYTPRDIDIPYTNVKPYLETALHDAFPEAEQEIRQTMIDYMGQGFDPITTPVWNGYCEMETGVYDFTISIDAVSGELLNGIRIPKNSLNIDASGNLVYDPVVDLTAQYDGDDPLVQQAAEDYAKDVMGKGKEGIKGLVPIQGTTSMNMGECKGFEIALDNGDTYLIRVSLCNLTIAYFEKR